MPSGQWRSPLDDMALWLSKMRPVGREDDDQRGGNRLAVGRLATGIPYKRLKMLPLMIGARVIQPQLWRHISKENGIVGTEAYF